MKKDILLIIPIVTFLVLFGFLILYNFSAIDTINNNMNYMANYIQVQRTDIGNIESLGMFDPQTKNILIETNGRTNQEICLTFLHELGHKINQEVKGTKEYKEAFADNYKYNHGKLCEEL